ncbi:restriction endonuclease subunit S [Patescibacteria group bacterium]|nr:restriction endonuclease subunit S [Patescibacteria group bacterium]
MIATQVRKLKLENCDRLDPEYYDIKFIKLSERLSSAIDLESFVEITAGSTLTDCASFLTDAYYIKTGDFKDYGIDFDSCARVSTESRGVDIQPNDILVTRKGSVGSIELIDDISDKHIFISSEVLRLRCSNNLKKIDPYYLAAFLSSSIGQSQIKRFLSGMSILSIAQADIKKIKIAICDDHDNVASLFQKAKKYLNQFQKDYAQAENLFLKNLKEHKSDYSRNSFGFEIKINEIKKNDNLDPELYFFKDSLNEYAILSDIVEIESGTEVGTSSYQKSGCKFLRVGNVTKYGLIGKDEKHINNEVFVRLKNRYQPKLNDILLTKDGTPGIALVVDQELNVIISGGIVRLIIKDTSYDPSYIALVINSRFGQKQIRSLAGGSNIKHLKIMDIGKIKIPLLPKDLVKQISSLAKESLNLKKKGTELKIEAIGSITKK